MAKQRIHKVLSEAGVASRRAVEEMIIEGRITVNHEPVTRLPCFVDLAEDDVHVDGRRIRLRTAPKVYLLLNKPRGVVCTQSDPQGRPRAVDLVPQVPGRIYCVGRLDVASTGLIVLTNDGELTQHLTHPSHGVVKTYVAEVDGRLGAEEITKLKAGLYVGPKRTQRAGVTVLRRSPKRSLVEIKVAEGRNREVRRMLAKVGHKVRRLKRVAIGSITDRGLKIGSCRALTRAEVAQLRKAAAQKPVAQKPAASGGTGETAAARDDGRPPAARRPGKKTPGRANSRSRPRRRTK